MERANRKSPDRMIEALAARKRTTPLFDSSRLLSTGYGRGSLPQTGLRAPARARSPKCRCSTFQDYPRHQPAPFRVNKRVSLTNGETYPEFLSLHSLTTNKDRAIAVPVSKAHKCIYVNSLRGCPFGRYQECTLWQTSKSPNLQSTFCTGRSILGSGDSLRRLKKPNCGWSNGQHTLRTEVPVAFGDGWTRAKLVLQESGAVFTSIEKALLSIWNKWLEPQHSALSIGSLLLA